MILDVLSGSVIHNHIQIQYFCVFICTVDHLSYSVQFGSSQRFSCMVSVEFVVLLNCNSIDILQY